MTFSTRMIALCSVLAMTATAARCAQPAPATQPQTRPAVPPIRKLTLHPSPATQPTSAHRLLPAVVDQTPGNAVLLYLQTHRFWPDQKTTDEVLYPENHKYDYEMTPIDRFPRKYAERLLAAYSTTLALADAGARRREAIWDTGWGELGLGRPFSYAYLNDLRHAENLLAFRAQYQVSQKRWTDAEYTLRTSFSIAHQLGTQPTLVQSLVESGFAGIALSNDVEEWVARDGSPNLYWALTDLPRPFIDLAPVERWEQLAWKRWKPRLYEAFEGKLPADQWPALIGQMIVMEHDSRSATKLDPATIETRVRRLVDSALPRARRYLGSHGVSGEKLAAMSPDEVVGKYLVEEYLAASDDLWKYWTLPFPQAQEGKMQSWRMLAPDKPPASENPLIQANLVSWDFQAGRPEARPEDVPRIFRMRYYMIRPDRQIALMRTIEALRDYAARHDGQPPQRLEQITDLPLPVDPMTGEPFEYHLSGNVARLDAAPPPGFSVYNGWYFELTFAK